VYNKKKSYQKTIRHRRTRIDKLARSITDGYNILRLSGRGHEDFLLFEDSKGSSHPISGEYLKRLIGAVREVRDVALQNIAKTAQEG
jgi:hypothetical protein